MLFRSEHDYNQAAMAVDCALRHSEFACKATPSEQEFRASLSESYEDLKQLAATAPAAEPAGTWPSDRGHKEAQN